MNVSKIIYCGTTLIDLTGDTVTAGAVTKGVTFHNSAGDKVVGTKEEVTVTDDGAGNVTMTGVAVVSNDSGNVTVS